MIDIKDIENQIINADCMDILKQLPDKCIDLVLTDPPYLYKSLGGKGSFLEQNVKKISNDLNDIKDGFDIDAVFTEFKRLTKKFNLFCICSNSQISSIMNWGEKNKYITNLLIWHKPNVAPFANGVWKQDCEFCVHIRESGAYFEGKAEIKNKVITLPTTSSKWGHPTEKPLKIIERYLTLGSAENDLILDCFSGSGTTAVACHNLKRRFICIEKDYDYWKASVERLENVQAQMKLF